MNSREPREPRGHDILLTRAYQYANFADAHNMQIWSYHDLVLSKAHADIYYHVIVGLLIELSESRLGICNETRNICL